jgi:hypothetical protein
LRYVKLWADQKTTESLLFVNEIPPLPAYLTPMHQPPFDLFGEIPVTHEDIEAWVHAVAPRWMEPRRSFESYVRAWDVPAKIRAAKVSGTFEAIIDQPRQPWHVRLALNAIL